MIGARGAEQFASKGRWQGLWGWWDTEGKMRSNDSVRKIPHQLGSEMGSIATWKLQGRHTSVCPVLFEQKSVKLNTSVG